MLHEQYFNLFFKEKNKDVNYNLTIFKWNTCGRILSFTEENIFQFS